MVVWFAQADFGRHEVGCAACRLGFGISWLELSADSEIAKLQDAILSYENVLSFYVSVQDILVKHDHHCHHNVSKISKNLFGWELCSWLNFLLDGRVKIASSCILHDDVYFIITRKRLVELHNGWANKNFQEWHFFLGISFVIFRHEG